MAISEKIQQIIDHRQGRGLRRGNDARAEGRQGILPRKRGRARLR